MVDTPGRPARLQWSTTDVDPRHALEYWVDTICKSFLEIDIDSPDRNQFHAHLDQSDLGPATMYVVEAATQNICRTPARIARSRYGGYFLLQLQSGRLRLQQYGRESCMEADDCVLIDCNAPYRLECLNATRSISLRFPQEWLRNWLPAPERIAGSPFSSKSGWGKTLASALANLDTDRDAPLALPDGVVAEQIAALLALAAGPNAQAPRGRDKLVRRIRRTMQDRCNEAGLTPADIASMHGISKRYIHHLFALEDSTFGNEMMRMRLECARRLLSDARYAALRVNEVAARCGFSEPSHFARRFRNAYGHGPKEFRALTTQLGTAAP